MQDSCFISFSTFFLQNDTQKIKSLRNNQLIHGMIR